MPNYTVDLRISARQLSRYYAGQAQQVLAYSRCGRRVQFPLHWLRPHVQHDGLRGTFVLSTDDRHRLRTLERVP